jgi:hypothetical protein
MPPNFRVAPSGQLTVYGYHQVLVRDMRFLFKHAHLHGWRPGAKGYCQLELFGTSLGWPESEFEILRLQLRRARS